MSVLQSLKNSYTYYGIILILEGLLFLIYPHLILKLLFLSPLETTQAEQYARVLGLAIAVIGFYYVIAGQCTLMEFYRASVIARLFIFPIFGAMVYFWSIEISFLLIGIQDIVTSLWSYSYLKAYDKESRKIKK